MSKVEIRDNECQLFIKIKNIEMDVPARCCSFVGENETNEMILEVSAIGGFVMSITCYCDYVTESDEEINKLKTKYNSERLRKTANVGYTPRGFDDIDLNNCGDFKIVFNSKDLYIMFGPSFNNKIYINGRTEYIIDVNGDLSYVHISNLSPEEYAILKKYKTDRPIEDFAPIA